mmetsp:Transcript_28629/g.69358  ORF Transcript_28629/g.69358 Transcript_28629/m.69358 type:complete len:108 (+) Transcript_28629:1003-1326(+)
MLASVVDLVADHQNRRKTADPTKHRSGAKAVGAPPCASSRKERRGSRATIPGVIAGNTSGQSDARKKGSQTSCYFCKCRQAIWLSYISHPVQKTVFLSPGMKQSRDE